MPGTAYSVTKSAILQMARSMACELGPKKIRVNSLSPTYLLTEYVQCISRMPNSLTFYVGSMVIPVLDEIPGIRELWESQNPLGRLGSPHELRGVVTWLASDASTYCTGSE